MQLGRERMGSEAGWAAGLEPAGSLMGRLQDWTHTSEY
jgi:hypothetical protein